MPPNESFETGFSLNYFVDVNSGSPHDAKATIPGCKNLLCLPEECSDRSHEVRSPILSSSEMDAFSVDEESSSMFIASQTVVGAQRMKRRQRRNERERKRVRIFGQAVDDLQHTIWRERVENAVQRRPRTAVIKRAVAYISLLTEVLEGNVSPKLSDMVKEFVYLAPDCKPIAFDRGQRLRDILCRHEAEKGRQASGGVFSS